MHRNLGLAVTLAWCMLAGCAKTEPPARSTAVPNSAIWVGGQDGGSWIDCHFASKEPHVAYRCNMFTDNGLAWASGTYVLAIVRCVGGKCLNLPAASSARADVSKYEAFDGVSILINDSRALIPDGTIDHPFGKGHGKRARYTLGKELSEEQY